MLSDSLKVGDVFLAKNLALSGNDPHYHIVVHKTNENKIVAVYTTKEIEKTEKRCRAKEKPKFEHLELTTMVLIDETFCDDLSYESAINCNNVQFKPESFFLGLQAFKILKPLKDKSILSKIITGIKDSPIAPDEIIKLFNP